MVLELQVEMDKSTIVVGDYDTYILVLDRKNKDIDHLNNTS